MDNAYKKINFILVNLINEIWDLEGKAIITDEFKDITNNDMHVIEAIGLGSLTTAMNSLVRKKYAERYRSEEDRRVVYVKLTEKGERAYNHHADYHHKMTMAIREKLGEEELPVLFKMLDALTEFFKDYSEHA